MTGTDAGGRALTLITGGSRGIGRHLVRIFLGETDVLNISRKPAEAAAGDTAHRLHNLPLDLGNTADIGPSLNAWFDTHPGYAVRLLIHNAATVNPGWLDQVSPEEIEHAFRVNVYAPLAVTTSLFRGGRFAESEVRVIYAVSSLARPLPELSYAGLGLYSVTKAALSRLALIQSREFALTAPQIKVLRVHPGIVDTDLQREIRADHRIDPAFADKTAGLPDYREGEWTGHAPKDRMRTVSAEFAAEFVAWTARTPQISSTEYDFYHTEQFHRAHATR
jgi:NAD(P)-dependent dehydrogenase (short-subunit alcohol dehydrogenase family)